MLIIDKYTKKKGKKKILILVIKFIILIYFERFDYDILNEFRGKKETE